MGASPPQRVYDGARIASPRREFRMAYSLESFCADAHAILTSQPLDSALPAVADRPRGLLLNPDFVAKTFSDDLPPGKRVLHHDEGLDFYVLAHVQEGG